MSIPHGSLPSGSSPPSTWKKNNQFKEFLSSIVEGISFVKSTWGTRPVSTTQARISSKLWWRELAHTLSLSWKLSHTLSLSRKRNSNILISKRCSHPCSGQQRSQVPLLMSVLIPHVHHDFSISSNSKIKIYICSSVWQQFGPWSVYLLCPFKCRGYNLQSSCSKLISKTTVAFLLPSNMPNTSTIISAKSSWGFIYIYLEAWLFGLDNQTQVWCSKVQVKTT